MKPEYYKEMEKRDRLIRIYDGDRLGAIITYYLGEKDDRKDMWDIPVEDLESTTLHIDHLISKMEELNTRLTIAIWHNLKQILKEKHPHIKTIKWNRAGKGERVCIL
jgi:hypothetical protein